MSSWPPLAWRSVAYLTSSAHSNKYGETMAAQNAPGYECTPPWATRPNRLAAWFLEHNSGPQALKWMHYFDAYHRHFEPVKNARARANAEAQASAEAKANGAPTERPTDSVQRPLRMLEVGVNAGGSIGMWRDYFGDDFEYHGIDINPECARFHKPHANEHLHIGSQLNRTFLREVVAAYGPFDIVLDDGGHHVDMQVVTFEEVWPAVVPGGVFMVEDSFSSYTRKFGGYRQSRGG
mmetsp:Transcript_89430/g.255380  ORF Transcript_89430/g.255380 Transcript_89430/m.255380 type:complete len:236 (-) Transcript_89430:4-711(-)